MFNSNNKLDSHYNQRETAFVKISTDHGPSRKYLLELRTKILIEINKRPEGDALKGSILKEFLGK